MLPHPRKNRSSPLPSSSEREHRAVPMPTVSAARACQKRCRLKSRRGATKWEAHSLHPDALILHLYDRSSCCSSSNPKFKNSSPIKTLNNDALSAAKKSGSKLVASMTDRIDDRPQLHPMSNLSHPSLKTVRLGRSRAGCGWMARQTENLQAGTCATGSRLGIMRGNIVNQKKGWEGIPCLEAEMPRSSALYCADCTGCESRLSQYITLMVHIQRLRSMSYQSQRRRDDPCKVAAETETTQG